MDTQPVEVKPLSTTPRQLDYAEAPPWHRSSRVRRWVMRIFLLSVGTLTAIYGYRFAQQVQYLYWQRKCMNYVVPTDFRWSAAQPMGHARSHPEAAELMRRIRPLSRESGTCVLLHRFSNGKLGERLVAVHFLDHPGFESVRAYAWEPATLVLGSRIRTKQGFELYIDRSTLHGWRLDPTDESHFTIAYELDGQNGIIDGWLMDDDSVKLEVRDGPLKR